MKIFFPKTKFSFKTKPFSNKSKNSLLHSISLKKNFTQSENEKCDKIDKIKEEIKKQNEKIENEENAEVKITDFFKFMDENIQKETEAFIKNKKIDESNSDDVVDDVNELLKLVKCPITEDELEACDEGLKISVN